MAVILANGDTPSKEEYAIALSKLVDELHLDQATDILEKLGYSNNAVTNIIYTAHCVTIRNS